MIPRLTLVVLLAAVSAVAGCRSRKPINFAAELPPGQVALRKIPPEKYPDFSRCTWNLAVLGRAAEQSIIYLQHPSSTRGFPYLDITHDRALATCAAFRQLVERAQQQPDPGRYIDQRIRADFEVYQSIGAPDPEGGGYTDTVLFTGYFTPIYEASLTRQGPYQWPIYKKPAELVVNQETGETAPWLTRRQIEAGAMAGQELCWLTSRWEAYVVTVQGSARLRLPDGTIYEVGYAGNNGHEYTSPGQAMVRDGVITTADLNIKRLGQVFAQRPELMDKYLWLNDRTVFFTPRSGGPYGALNVPVTTFSTIATDKTLDRVTGMTVYPRALPAFLNVPIPRVDQPEQAWQFTGFMMDQDTGGAIRAAGRCDIYMGVGEAGEAVAGHQLHQGALYYVALKPELVGPILGRPAPARP
jgi:membrane-bound lytic murein transglycosylase A